MLQVLVRFAGCCVFILSIACAPPLGAQTQRRPPIILISVDTLRADHLGAYGYRPVATPNIDRLASGGTLFSQVNAQTPLTLPSHASLFTSRYPALTGIRDNGEQLAPGAVTLATQLKGMGYRTAAFIGGFALDRRFGLNQGFDHYDSPFDLRLNSGGDPGDLKRPAQDVVRAARKWIDENASAPFFVFLHLYDLHTPYDLPRQLQLRFHGASYDSELAYVDETLGSFWKFLSDRKLFDRSLLIFTSDHGEGLGDHGESTHGFFIYQSTMHVPLIVHWPGGSPKFPQRVDRPLELIQLAPTVLEFLGARVPPEMQGRPLLAGAGQQQSSDDPPVYSESYYASRHFGCAPLRSVRVGKYKYIDAPKPELYDLSADGAEQRNLYATRRSIAAALRQKLRALYAAGKPGKQQPAVNPEAMAALRSLGYLGGGDSGSAVSGNDPKDRVADFEAHNRAILLASSGKLAESNAMLEKLIQKLPDVLELRISMGLNRQKMGQHAQAISLFEEVIKRMPQSATTHFNLALSYYEIDQLDAALPHLQAAVALEPYYTRAEELLGTIWSHKKDYARARASFEHLLKIAPDNFAAQFNLGVIAAFEGKWDEGESRFNRSLQIDPNSAEAHNALGSLYLRRGALVQAKASFALAIRLRPRFAWAHYNLGLAFDREDRKEDAAREFRAALDADPKFTAARKALERVDHPSPR
jgi:tetratricopeptide (TPR) repeat protein